MAPTDKNRFNSMADCYDKIAGYLVPRYHFLQDEVIALLLGEKEPELVVDLGGGGGTFLEKVLTVYPTSKAVWVDSSEGFYPIAQERLSKFQGRVKFVTSSFEGNWEAKLPQAPDVICSMSAIHHLDTKGKQSLYGKCFDALSPGGWFFNIDEMSTIYEDAYWRTLDYWVSYVDMEQQDVPNKLTTQCKMWCEKFDDWKQRNIDNIDQPKQAGDDIHECFISQMQWLKDAGFVNIDLFIKFQLWSVIGGQKPASL